MNASRLAAVMTTWPDASQTAAALRKLADDLRGGPLNDGTVLTVANGILDLREKGKVSDDTLWDVQVDLDMAQRLKKQQMPGWLRIERQDLTETKRHRYQDVINALGAVDALRDPGWYPEMIEAQMQNKDLALEVIVQRLRGDADKIAPVPAAKEKGWLGQFFESILEPKNVATNLLALVVGFVLGKVT